MATVPACGFGKMGGTAANDVRDAVSRVMDRLPDEADAPEIAKVEADADPIMWLNMASSRMDTLELSDYADRYVVDRLSALDGVSQVRISGDQKYAMRIWLDREKLAAHGLTVSDVESVLRRENVELPAGRTVTLRPGAEHLMLMDLSQPLTIGEAAELTLIFQNAPDVTVQADVREPVAASTDPGV